MRSETKPSRYFPHTHKTMLAAIRIASALARRSAPERPAWSSRDDLPAPFLILPRPPARSKCLVCDFGQSHTSAPRFKQSVRNISLSYRLGRGAQPLFINRSRTVQFARESRETVRVVWRVEGRSPNRRVHGHPPRPLHRRRRLGGSIAGGPPAARGRRGADGVRKRKVGQWHVGKHRPSAP